MRILITVGHRPHAPGAANMGGPDPDDDVYEYHLNKPVAYETARRLESMGIDAVADEYVAGGNVARWNGASDLLVELHCNASGSGTASGTEMIHAPGSIRGVEAAQILQRHLVAALRLPDRGIHTPWNGRGNYLLLGVRQPAVIAEPYFIDNDRDLARARQVDLAAAYAGALAEIAGRWGEAPGRRAGA